MKNCIVPGSFNPITNGHLDLIRRVSRHFDKVIVAVAESKKKNPIFSLEKRLMLVKIACDDLDNVDVESFDGLLVDFAKQHNCNVLVRGLRGVADFENDFQMAAINHELDKDLETFFISSPPEYMYLSSTHVRELASLGGDISSMVPPCVNKAFKHICLKK